MRYILFTLLLNCTVLFADAAPTIHHPKTEGLEHFIVLNNQWVIVVFNNIEDVVKSMDKLSNGSYGSLAEAWESTRNNPKPHWGARHGMKKLQEQFLAKARIDAGERLFDSPKFFHISSDEDSNYRNVQVPTQCTRYIAMLGKDRVPGLHNLHYAHYCYLQMPEPLVSGRTYQIETNDGRKVSFLFDEMQTISRAIKVNQVGYLDSAKHKFAYLGAYLHELGTIGFSDQKTFRVFNAKTGELAHVGPIRIRATANTNRHPEIRKLNPNDTAYITGEHVYELDLSGLKESGDFFISIPGVGRSWTFHHGPDVYGEVFYHTCRALYHQRCGIGIESDYSAWTRDKCHQDPVYESDNLGFLPLIPIPKNYSPFDVIARTIDYTRKHLDATGGWHDAADWDRKGDHLACAFDLLNAYELAPQKFKDGQLNIPESGNGIPDVLDEAEYGLRVWRKSQDERGGISGAVETWTHPPMQDDDIHYAFAQRTRWNSLLYSAAAAQYASLIAPFNQERAELYAASAEKAFEYGVTPENSLGTTTLSARADRGKGDDYSFTFEDPDDVLLPYEIHARLRLYILTEDKDYLTGMEELLEETPQPFEHPLGHRGIALYLFSGLFHEKLADALPKRVINDWRAKFMVHAGEMARLSHQQPYRQCWPAKQDYWMAWGATCFYNQAKTMMLAYEITQMDGFRERAIQNCDFMLGANPMGMSWTTGLGTCYPIEIQHAVSELDGIRDPVPGITIFGDTGGICGHHRQWIWASPDEEEERIELMTVENQYLPLWHLWSCHPHINTPQCEFTIHETVSSSVLVSALLLPDNWMPSEELKGRQPREEEDLVGYWYLP